MEEFEQEPPTPVPWRVPKDRPAPEPSEDVPDVHSRVTRKRGMDHMGDLLSSMGADLGLFGSGSKGSARQRTSGNGPPEDYTPEPRLRRWLNGRF
jgi:hypothetical protein